jgi:surfactin synthase thioesterase subunit
MTEIARLICFHHAGGASTSFRALTRALGPRIPVTAVNLPGRESRCREPRHRDVYACATQLADELSPHLDRPHVLLGHSRGAIIAYTIAQQRIAAFRRGPDALIVASYAAPHLPSDIAQIDSADDMQLATTLSQLGGLPAVVLTRPDWLAARMPLVRDDLRICASHRDRGEPALPCPIHVFSGDADPVVTRAALAGWRRHTRRPRPVTIVPGGHFLFRDPHVGLVGAIAAIVADSARQPLPHRHDVAVNSTGVACPQLRSGRCKQLCIIEDLVTVRYVRKRCATT